MRVAFHTIQERQKENLHLIKDMEQRKERLRKVKSEAIGNDVLFESAIMNLRKNGFRVELAKDDTEALEILRREIGSEKLIVKSKSNISKEIDLTHHLEESGIEIIETDLGDRIIQISGREPVHPTGPAAHLSRYEIAEILSEHFKRKLPPDPDILSETVREELDNYFKRAKIGITGANAIAALEGAAVIVHNEGNVTRCTQSQNKHIILTTRDKIVPCLDDAINLVKLQTFFATGKLLSAHIDIISSPSYTADIEKKIFKGMHGPKEIMIIFVDSGRNELGNSELLYCINCGNCLLTCPVYDVIGPAFGSRGHNGGIGVALVGKQRNAMGADERGLFLCSSCGICKEQCPVNIDIRPDIYEIRGEALKDDQVAEEQKSALASIRNYDNPWMQPRSARTRWAKTLELPVKGEYLYYPGCSISYLHPEIAKKTVGLLREAGIEPAYLGEREVCCGSIGRKLGDQEQFNDQMKRLFNEIEETGAKKVITSCPGCMISLNMGKELLNKKDVEIIHITQALSGLPKEFAVSDKKITVTYHDPCELGRGLGIFDPPRDLIRNIDGVNLKEMERSGKESACCGAGAGLRSGYPELARAISDKRLNMARGTGASVLLTCCPWCLENLSEISESMDVRDLVDLLYDLRRSRKA